MPERLRSEGVVVLVPGLAVVALFVYWGASEGGYQPTTWLPSALLVLGLLVATVVGLGPGRLRLARPAAIALAALTAYTAWSYLSIAWAASPGDALSGSNRTLLYLLLFGLFALLPWRTWTALVVLSAFALGIGVIAVVVLFQLGSAEQVQELFTDARLSKPVGYVNGTPALFTLAAIVSIALAARRELPVALRAVLLALATAGLQVAVLSESRGWLFALPAIAVAMLLLTPSRVRFALWSLPPLAGGLIALPALLDVFQRPDALAWDTASAVYDRVFADAAAHAGSLALPLCAAVLVAGLALALLDQRVEVPARTAAGANRVAVGLAALALIGGAAAGLAVTDGRPDRALADYWDRSSGYKETDSGSSRFASVGSNRPDFWRVALDALAAHPIGGLGQDNWSDYYLRDRDSHEDPRWVHSLQLRLLAHTGAVGFLLFAAFLAAAVAAALRGRRSGGADPLATAVAAAALAPLVVWLVHGTIDWFWEIPILSGPAFAFAGLATAVMRPQRKPEPAAAGSQPASARRGLARTSGLLVALGAATLVAAVTAVLVLPYLAERETADAAEHWQRDPAVALRQLDRAAELDPLSARPDLTAGVIALELRQPEIARGRFDRAIERDPDDWFAHLGRGLSESAMGDRDAARADYLRGHELSPAEPLLDDALRRLDSRRPLTAAETFARLRRNVEQLTGSD